MMWQFESSMLDLHHAEILMEDMHMSLSNITSTVLAACRWDETLDRLTSLSEMKQLADLKLRLRNSRCFVRRERSGALLVTFVRRASSSSHSIPLHVYVVNPRGDDSLLVPSTSDSVGNLADSGGAASTTSDMDAAQSKPLVANVDRAFSSCYAAGVYASLLLGRAVHEDDLNRALSFCSETLIEFDISQFLALLTYMKSKLSEDE
jgi:hypothetical protein